MSKELERERDRWKMEAVKWAEATENAIKGSVRVAQENEILEQDNKQLSHALTTAQNWLDRWARHVGECEGENMCTCGLTLTRLEVNVALYGEE